MLKYEVEFTINMCNINILATKIKLFILGKLYKNNKMFLDKIDKLLQTNKPIYPTNQQNIQELFSNISILQQIKNYCQITRDIITYFTL